MKTKGKEIAFLLIAMAVVVMGRLPWSVWDVLDWDESLYLVVAQNILDGGVPYVTSFEQKGPLLFFLLAAAVKVTGANIFLIRMFTTAYVCLTMLVVYCIGRRILPGAVGVVSALVCGLFLSNGNLEGLASNGELFMMLPAAAAWYFYVDFRRRQAWRRLLLSGFFAAAASLIKPQAFFTVCLIPVAFSLEEAARKRYGALGRRLAVYAAGAALPCITVLAYFAAHHALRDLFDSYRYGYRYVHLLSARDGFINLGRFLKHVLVEKPDPITLLALGSLIFIALRRGYSGEEKRIVWAVAALTLFSLVGVYLGRNMFPHYFLQMAFPFSLAVGLALSFLRLPERTYEKLVAAILVVAVPVVFNPRPLREFPHWDQGTAFRVAGYLQAHTGPDDTIFVLGGEPVVYFFAHRRAPTKYFFWIQHTDKYQRVAPIREEVLAQLAAARPRYFAYRKDKSGGVPYLEDFMRRNYHLESTLDDYFLYRVNDSS